jgi:flavin reductase (DIM6/NTAB) family NADH-FMN oxidoreductase RutF
MSGLADVALLLDPPMYVVTTIGDGERSGCLVGFATQVSVKPGRYLIGLSDKNHTYRVAQHADRLAVHALGRDRHDLAELFGSHTGDDIDKFTRCRWSEGPDGVPVLDEAAAWFSGPILERYRLGDHVGHLIEPDSGEVRDGEAELLRFDDVRDLDPGHDA